MRIPIRRFVSGSLFAIACLVPAGPAAAVSSGPLPLVFPSAIYPELAETQALTGSVALDVDGVPVAAPTLFHLTDVSVVASGGASFALDPSVPSPGLGVVQASGSFLIPTLFLHVVDGATSFDLAVPNVDGTLVFGAGGDVTGVSSTFQVDSGTGGILTVTLVAPEPDGALLIVCALGTLLIRKEMAR
jgi:hypothetical protein